MDNQPNHYKVVIIGTGFGGTMGEMTMSCLPQMISVGTLMSFVFGG